MEFTSHDILLHYFPGLNDREIAELLNAPYGTISYRRTNSLKKLRKIREVFIDGEHRK